MLRILVVANKTLGSSDLLKSIQDRMTKGPCEFTILVPGIPPSRPQDTVEKLTRRKTNLPVNCEARRAE